MDEDDWEETTINGEVAYQWSYEDERTQGFLIVYSLPDGRINFSVADTAIGELDDDIYDLFIDIIESIETYFPTTDLDSNVELSETALSDNLSFMFQYPEGWELSEVAELPTGVLISPTVESNTINDFSGNAWLIISQIPPEALGIDPDAMDEFDEITMTMLESYAEAATEDGITFEIVEIVEIDGVLVGRTGAQNNNIIYTFIFEDSFVQVWILNDDPETFVILDEIAQELIPTISAAMSDPIRSLDAPPSDFSITSDDLDATYEMQNGIVFDYPEAWTIQEDNGLALVSNLEDIDDFTAQPDEILLIISAVPTEEQDIAGTLAKLQEISSTMADLPDFDVNIFRIDEGEPSDLTFDVGEAAEDWNFSGGLISAGDGSFNGSIFIIMSQDVYTQDFATSIINPILNSFRNEADD